MTTVQAESSVTADGVIRHTFADHERLPEGPWDGRKYSYIPRYPLPLGDKVELHTDFDRDIDPITHQVLRSRFWHQNLEHGDVLKRVSGSQVVVESQDFATSILTESGDVVVVSPTIQYFSVQSDLTVKWTLEHRGADGIADGDIFLQNDPFVATAQQADTAVYAPLFWEGRIFAWIYNMSHIGDLGGIDPGGWSINARDIFDEATGIPPVKLAREGTVQQEIVEAFSRQSRDATMIVVGLKGAIAGIEATRRQMLATLERYGAPTVKGTMRKMIADTSRVVSERLRRIPDGTWSERVYVTGVSGDDDVSHNEVITLTKRGDRITCTNRGTSPQAGAGNSPLAVLRASVVAAVAAGVAYDQRGCAAGVANHVFFEPVPGTRNVPTHPAAVSGILSTMITVNLAGIVTSKMLLAGPEELRRHANASGSLANPLANFTVGLTERGEHVGVDAIHGGATNPTGTGFGAFPFRDGVDAGGAWWLMGTTAGNVEEMESAGVVLAVYRIEEEDSGGPGQWRGGNGISVALIKHKIFQAIAQHAYIDPSANNSIGLAGGYYGLGGNFLRVKGLDKALAAGRMASRRRDLLELSGEAAERLHPRGLIFPLPEGDCLISEYTGGGGYGDPLLRDPRRVARDVADFKVSRAAAERHWGVVLDEAGRVDEEATGRRRAEIKEERFRRAAKPGPSLGTADPEAEPLLPGAGGSVDVVAGPDGPAWACRECGELLGDVTDTYKRACARIEGPPQSFDELLYSDPGTFGDPEIILRQYACPSCATLLGQDFCHSADDPYTDFSLQLGETR